MKRIKEYIKEWKRKNKEEAEKRDERLKSALESLGKEGVKEYIFEKELEIIEINAQFRRNILIILLAMFIGNISGVTDGATFLQINYVALLIISYTTISYLVELYDTKKNIKRVKKYQ